MKQKLINLGQYLSSSLARFFHRKRLIRYAVYLSILLVLYLCRVPIMRGFGNYLMPEDEPENANAVYVLGGSAYDRANKAFLLYEKGFSQKFYCTGGHVSKEFELFDTIMTESEITKSLMLKKGIPEKNITAINEGFSTRDESEIIYKHAQKNKFKKIIILSSKFHLRRVRNVFEKKFEGSGIKPVFVGASSAYYDENEWWKYEQGLIMVNNEYLKLWYYWWTE